MCTVAVLAGVLRHIAALSSAVVPVMGLILAPCRIPAVGVARSDGADIATGVAVGVGIIVVVVCTVAVLAGVFGYIAAFGGAFMPVVGVVRRPLGCPAVGVCGRLDGACVSAGVTGGVRIIVIVMLAVTVLFAVLGHIATIGSALVPVMGIVLTPCSFPAMGVARSDGALVVAGVAGGVGIVGVDVRAFLNLCAAAGIFLPVLVGVGLDPVAQRTLMVGGIDGNGEVGDLAAVCSEVLIAAGAVLVTLRTGGLAGGRDFADPRAEGVVACVDLAALKGFRALFAADAGLIIGRLCRTGGIARLVIGGCDLLIVGMGSVAVLVCIIGHVAAVGGALMPVVSLVLTPCSCPAMGVRRACCQLQPVPPVLPDIGVCIICEEIA